MEYFFRALHAERFAPEMTRRNLSMRRMTRAADAREQQSPRAADTRSRRATAGPRRAGAAGPPGATPLLFLLAPQ
ncbi:hypothetical protein, partial [Burkholderia territorii]|uniref:hypothetical protein n=1 Tax=Burkholderia territorii TaxID=1503055 RepID=UPI001BA5790F